jgi:hypothetical protein
VSTLRERKLATLGAVCAAAVGLLCGGCVADTGYVGTSSGYYYDTPLPDPYFYDTPTYYEGYYVVPPPAYAPRVYPRRDWHQRDRNEWERDRRRRGDDNKGGHEHGPRRTNRPSVGPVPPPSTVSPTPGRTPRPHLPGIPTQPRPTRTDPKHAPQSDPPSKQR